MLAVNSIFFGQLARAPETVLLLPVGFEKLNTGPAGLFHTDGIYERGFFHGAQGECARREIVTVLRRIPARSGQTKAVANKAPGAVFRLSFQSLH